VTPLPAPLGSGDLRFWRIDQKRHAETWDTGEGAYLAGGRWNSPGVRVVYCAIDPATAILEVAVHKGFKVLDTSPHVLTSARVPDWSSIHIVHPDNIPNPNWLVPGNHGPGQQAFGDSLLKAHLFCLVPSTVSRHSWNLIFLAGKAKDHFDDVVQEPFALDPPLHT